MVKTSVKVLNELLITNCFLIRVNSSYFIYAVNFLDIIDEFFQNIIVLYNYRYLSVKNTGFTAKGNALDVHVHIIRNHFGQFVGQT